jgi:hypothetical protein
VENSRPAIREPMSHNPSVGRESLLTEELRGKVERELAAGTPVSVAAQRLGLSRRSLTRWLSEGRVVRRQLDAVPAGPDLDLPAVRRSASLSEQLEKAEPALVAAIAAAAKRGSWQAAAWLLERSHPERWARPPAREGQVYRPVPREADPFAEVDEIAERRRRRR